MNIGFIGTGVIATAMIQGIANDGHQIFVTERSQANSSKLAEMYQNVTIASGQQIVDNSEVVIISLLHHVARTLLPDLTFREGQKVLSVMVGMDRAELTELAHPATFDGTFIPYPHIAKGGSPLLACPASETIESLFGGNNTIIPVADEALLNSFLAAQAILCPTVKLLHETSQWLTERIGDAHSAETFIRVLVGSYLMTVEPREQDALQGLVSALGTEGGLNAQLRDHFTDEGVYGTLHNGLDKLEERLNS